MIYNSFPFRYEWGEVLRGLPREVRLEVYDAVIEYALSGTLTELKPNARLAFTFIKAGMDRDRETLTRHAGETAAQCDGQDYALAQSAEIGAKGQEEIEENLPPIPPIKEDKEESDVIIGLNIEDFNYINPKEKEKEKESREAQIVTSLKVDRLWLELIEMRYRLSESEIKDKLDEFALDQRIRDKKHINTTEAKRHFANWLNVKNREYDNHQDHQDQQRQQTAAKAERDSQFAAYIADKLAGGDAKPRDTEMSGKLF